MNFISPSSHLTQCVLRATSAVLDAGKTKANSKTSAPSVLKVWRARQKQAQPQHQSATSSKSTGEAKWTTEGRLLTEGRWWWCLSWVLKDELMVYREEIQRKCEGQIILCRVTISGMVWLDMGLKMRKMTDKTWKAGPELWRFLCHAGGLFAELYYERSGRVDEAGE